MKFSEKMSGAFNTVRQAAYAVVTYDDILPELGREIKHTLTHPRETAGYCAYGIASSVLEQIHYSALVHNDMKFADAVAYADLWLAEKLLPSLLSAERHADKSSGPV